MLDRLHFHRAVLDHIQEPVIACDKNGLVQYMNPVAERMTGWPLWEAVNRNIEELLNPTADREIGIDPLLHGEECLLQQPCTVETRWGRRLDRKVNVSPLYQGAYHFGTVLVFDRGLDKGEDQAD